MKNEKVVKLISVICAMLVFALVCVLVFQFVKINNLKQKEKELEVSLNVLEQQIVDYTNENNYLKSNEYLEDYAREVLGWGKENEMYFPGNWDENCPDELKVENCKTDFVYVDSKNCKCFVIKFQIDSCYFWNDRLITMMNDAIQNFIKQNGCRNVEYYTSGKQEFQYFNFIFFGCAKIGDE